jgi:hypothetical protein
LTGTQSSQATQLQGQLAGITGQGQALNTVTPAITDGLLSMIPKTWLG